MASQNTEPAASCIDILCVIAALFSGIPAVQAKTARLDARINTDAGTTNQYEPAVAMNRYGYAVVVWESRDAGDVVRVYGQILNEKGNAVLGNFAIDAFEGTGYQYRGGRRGERPGAFCRGLERLERRF